MPEPPKVPIPTLLRLATYYRVLAEAEDQGIPRLNSKRIGELCGISATQVRKDLSFFGVGGKPGVGYVPSQLRQSIARVLKLDRKHRVAIIGAGRLGQALAAYPGLEAYNLNVVAIFDTDRRKVGRSVGKNLTIEDATVIPRRLKQLKTRIVALTVPAAAAQEAAEQAVAGGANRILNFTPAHVSVPNGCIVRNVAFTPEFAVLAFFESDGNR
jgi:redox-sensing transcriptional repressor